MVLELIAPIAAVAGAAFGFVGQQKADAAGERNQRNANKAARQQWEFDKNQIERQNEYNQQSLEIAKQNYYNQRNYEIASANQEWQERQYIRDFTYNEQVRAYNKSEENYNKQISFNNLAAAQAYTSAQVGLKETEIQQSFEKQAANISFMEQAGKAQLGQAGNSLAASLQSTAAARGRDLAILDASLRSQQAATAEEMDDIALQLSGANMQAQENRMLKPIEMRQYSRPLTPPEQVFQEVFKGEAPPAPIDGIYGGAGIWGNLGQAASTLASVKWGGINKPSG